VSILTSGCTRGTQLHKRHPPSTHLVNHHPRPHSLRRPPEVPNGHQRTATVPHHKPSRQPNGESCASPAKWKVHAIEPGTNSTSRTRKMKMTPMGSRDLGRSCRAPGEYQIRSSQMTYPRAHLSSVCARCRFYKHRLLADQYRCAEVPCRRHYDDVSLGPPLLSFWNIGLERLLTMELPTYTSDHTQCITALTFL